MNGMHWSKVKMTAQRWQSIEMTIAKLSTIPRPKWPLEAQRKRPILRCKHFHRVRVSVTCCNQCKCVCCVHAEDVGDEAKNECLMLTTKQYLALSSIREQGESHSQGREHVADYAKQSHCRGQESVNCFDKFMSYYDNANRC